MVNHRHYNSIDNTQHTSCRVSLVPSNPDPSLPLLQKAPRRKIIQLQRPINVLHQFRPKLQMHSVLINVKEPVLLAVKVNDKAIC